MCIVFRPNSIHFFSHSRDLKEIFSSFFFLRLLHKNDFGSLKRIFVYLIKEELGGSISICHHPIYLNVNVEFVSVN